jgi:hypothetical protein
MYLRKIHYLCLMKEKVEIMVEELTRRAKDRGGKSTFSPGRNRSSLHKIIKTKQQANAFMRLLKSA